MTKPIFQASPAAQAVEPVRHDQINHLLDELVRLAGRRDVLHAEHMGKVMPAETLAVYCHIRDERIPALKAQIAAALAIQAAPAAVAVPLSDPDIDAAVYAQCPDFDAAHEGPSIDDMRAIVRAALAATPPAQSLAETVQTVFDALQNKIDAPGVISKGNLQHYVNLLRDAFDAAPQAQDVQRDADIQRAVLAERERICAAIKAEDDHCVTQGDYMLDSEDCIKVVRGEWVRPVYEIGSAASAAQEGGV